jgi:hypothetical protein
VRLVGRCSWDPTVIRELGVKKGSRLLVLVIDQDSEMAFADELKVIDKRQHDKFLEALQKWDAIPPEQRLPRPAYQDGLIDLELQLKVQYSKASDDQRRFYWALRTIQAGWVNGNHDYKNGFYSKLLPSHIITPMELHEADLEAFCEKFYLDADEKEAFAARRMVQGSQGRVVKVEPLKNGKVRVHYWKTTSYMDTKEMSAWTKVHLIDEIMNEGSLLKADVPEFIMLKNQFLDMVKGKR